MRGRITILFILFVSGVKGLSAQTVEEYSHILAEGHSAAGQEHIKQALDIWSRAAKNPDANLTDPRIGIAFIELVTERGLTSYYEEAVKLYYWGLQNPDHKAFEEILEEEFDRLQPIAGFEDSKSWKRLLKEDRYAELGLALTSFWTLSDPTVSTRYNERLIEHWQRIAYARKHFTKSVLQPMELMTVARFTFATVPRM